MLYCAVSLISPVLSADEEAELARALSDGDDSDADASSESESESEWLGTEEGAVFISRAHVQMAAWGLQQQDIFSLRWWFAAGASCTLTCTCLRWWLAAGTVICRL